MISVKEAKSIILNSTQNFGVEEIPFLKSVGRILKEEITADRDFPPFNRVAMDGIAIDFSSFQNGQRAFAIEGIQPAGSPQITLQNTVNCLEVMTGAVLPNNTNVVIRYEDVIIKNGEATIQIDEIKNLQNIHIKGKDRTAGDVLIYKNKIISAAEIGVFATVGKSTIKVAKQPKVMIISTGDELVGVEETPEAHQIRRSNVFTMVSLLERLNIDSETAHITDDKPLLKSKIKNYLDEYDVLLFSGAVSKGKYDFLPEVFEELGVEKLFHKVSQRPGKPFFYGKTFSCNIFGFPGNPISTFVNCLVYFYPWYYKSVGLEIKEETAILTKDVSFKPNLEYFLQVKLSDKFGHTLATPITGNGSGDLASLVHADAFIYLPSDKNEFKKGENFPIIRYR
ncbi:molybdopterin molybdotransferase MoeA [Polaribacter sp.]|uniref:molybdopterin molybdotransferase MoeA n=1 Tax=Polaribacter sp. TaxID=1920175 RepID=UPI003F6C78C7